MKDWFADWKLVLAMGGAAIAALAMIAYAFFRPAVDEKEAERKRRLHLNQIGRIAEGQVVELVEHPAEPQAKRKSLFGIGSRPLADLRPRQLVSYSYSISGVTYHTAQDITGLESQIRFRAIRQLSSSAFFMLHSCDSRDSSQNHSVLLLPVIPALPASKQFSCPSFDS